VTRPALSALLNGVRQFVARNGASIVKAFGVRMDTPDAHAEQLRYCQAPTPRQPKSRSQRFIAKPGDPSPALPEATRSQGTG